MKTPITDKFFDELPREYDWSDATDNKHEMRAFAERLELDRAALMEALDGLIKCADYNGQVPRWAGQFDVATAALSAARANFPEP